MAASDSLLILGRQPALGLAELESLYGANQLQPVQKEAAVLTVEPEAVDFSRLGGSVKLCKIFGSVETMKWPDIQKHLEEKIPQLAHNMPGGKITLGISAYGLDVKPQQLIAAGLSIKKILRSDGRSVRLVPNQTAALNSAQVLHNHLTHEKGCEIVLVSDNSRTIIATTVAEQDIESYTVRDRGRPKRDARVGMLPPKLAQIIINLAAGKEQKAKNNELTVLDPFCGTGVILQEALLLGYKVYGTDMETRMIDYSKSNIEWLQSTNIIKSANFELSEGDATTFKWKQPVDLVASELYLGQPFNALPSPEKLAQVRNACNTITEKFLSNIGMQVKPGTRFCIAVPSWQVGSDEFKHLPLIDRLSDLGYNQVKFEHVRNDQLLYYREDQIVARELLVLVKK